MAGIVDFLIEQSIEDNDEERRKQARRRKALTAGAMVAGLGYLHGNNLSEWWLRHRMNLAGIADDVDNYYMEEPEAGANDLLAKAQVGLGRVALGLWTLYQAGFKSELAEADESEITGRATMVDYVAVHDDDTCDACEEAAEGSPYVIDEAPLPGEVCWGGDYCRCELVPAGEGF